MERESGGGVDSGRVANFVTAKVSKTRPDGPDSVIVSTD